MQSDNLKYWIAFNRIRGIGRVRFKLLESSFDSIQAAWSANESELRAAGLDARTIRAIVNGRQSVDPDAELEALKRSGVRALTWHDADYPPRLKQIYDLPPLLYVKGELLPDDERSIAVVGTRKPSPYGVQVAEKMVRDIADAGVAVVSGLARGVDGIAHNAALNAGARTIAVLGSGVDVIYPREHQRLAARIAENGALVSEHPLGTRPDARNFPRRNRIMSGMTLGTLVIEAPENSGALITAQGRRSMKIGKCSQSPATSFRPAARASTALSGNPPPSLSPTAPKFWKSLTSPRFPAKSKWRRSSRKTKPKPNCCDTSHTIRFT